MERQHLNLNLNLSEPNAQFSSSLSSLSFLGLKHDSSRGFLNATVFLILRIHAAIITNI
jgi:hypothetical protein